MTDDRLRAALRRAHADDRPPAFEATLAAARARVSRRWLVPALALALATAAVAAGVVGVVLRSAPGAPEHALDGVGMSSTSLHLPLDSLLDVTGEDLLASTPSFDQGALP
jgi:hypothetical protein